jgi:hypothetical protein
MRGVGRSSSQPETIRRPVFDNATRAFERLLLSEGVPSPNIHRLSAVPDAADPASGCWYIDQRFTQLSKRPTGGAAERLEPARPALRWPIAGG